MNLDEMVRKAGVVGAGGGGFPTHVKLRARAETLIANGAECEPLLHKDAAIMESHAPEMIRGMELAMEAIGAREGVVGIKAKNRHAVEAVRDACSGTAIRVQLLGDYYPAGDEYDLVHEVTGKLIPPRGIPLQVGCVVCNVETFVNVAAAAEGRPVTRKTITLAGALRQPVNLTVAIGTTFRQALAATTEILADDPVLCIGGLMMGTTTDDLDTPITKTTGGAIVLPRDHPTVRRKLTPPASQAKIGKSACDQCRYCTEFCPRFLLGYAVEPHQVMRGLGFTLAGEERWNRWADLCCSCGLCTLYACPEDLFPKEACDDARDAMRRATIAAPPPPNTGAHPMRDGRRVPIRRLMKRLGVEDLNVTTPTRDGVLEPGRLTLPLKQGAGAQGTPAVAPGDAVSAGQPLTELPADKLGAIIHAPFAARVTAIEAGRIILERDR